MEHRRPFSAVASILTVLVFVLTIPDISLCDDDSALNESRLACGNAFTIEAPPWWIGYTLILSDVSTPAAMRDTVKRIREAGGRVGVMTEPDVVFGWLPAKNSSVLVAAGATAVFDKEIPSESLAGRHPNTQAAMRFFNAVVSGEFFARPTAPPGLEKRSCRPSAGTPVKGTTTT